MPEDVEIKSAATVKDGSLHQTIGQENGFEIKSDDEGRSFVTGYIATKDAYNIRGENFDQEVMEDEALQSIADQINSASQELKTADVAFPDPEAIEKTTGNIEHQNSRKRADMLPMLADTRTVPAIEFERAEFDGYGVEVKAPIREDALPDDTVEAVKKNIEDGILSAFSIEFRNAIDKVKEKGGKLKRFIKDVDVAGAGLTQKPKNPTAQLTGAEIKSIMEPRNNSYEELKNQIKNDIKKELKAEFAYEEGSWVSRDWQGGEVFGKIRDRTKDQFTVDGNTITGDEDEPVYKMEEYDEEEEEFTGQMIAVPQSGLQRWSSAPENKAVEDVDLSPPERVVNAAQAALDAKEEYSDSVGDCGTGVGESRAEKIVNDNLEPSDFTGGENTAIPDYLDSHEEDLSTDKPPTDWGKEEWTDGCGNLQYALWGYYKDWAQGVEQELMDEMDEMEEKATAAGVEFTDTMGGELDESEIPNDDFEQHYLFPADTKSESSYPVVDAEGNLRRGNVDAAHQLGARGGVDASELERKLKMLNDEFENPPIDFKEEEKHISGESMPEEQDGEPEGDAGDGEQEEKSVKESVEELKSTVEEVKSTNQELQEQNQQLQDENEELKSQIEDFEEIAELKSDIENIEEEIKSLEPSDKPQSQTNESRTQEEKSQKPATLRAASSEFIKEHKSQLAEKHDMTEEEVLDYA